MSDLFAEQARKKFEEFVRLKHPDWHDQVFWRDREGVYGYWDVKDMWDCWQAAQPPSSWYEEKARLISAEEHIAFNAYMAGKGDAFIGAPRIEQILKGD